MCAPTRSTNESSPAANPASAAAATSSSRSAPDSASSPASWAGHVPDAVGPAAETAASSVTSSVVTGWGARGVAAVEAPDPLAAVAEAVADTGEEPAWGSRSDPAQAEPNPATSRARPAVAPARQRRLRAVRRVGRLPDGVSMPSAGPPAEGPVGPAGGLPGGAARAVAPAQPPLLRAHLAERDRVQSAVLLPLREQEDGVGPLCRLLGGVHDVELGPAPLDVVAGGRVRDPHGRALQLQLGGDVERGGIADVAALGLEGGPQHGDPLAQQGAVADLASQLDHADPAAHVDVVHLAQEGQRLVRTQLAGPRHEGPDVLGQTPPTEPEAGVEELPADPVVVPDGIGQLLHVGTRGLAEF